MANKRLISIIITASIYLCISPLQAGVYKWIDENGQVHYGEKPGNTAAEEVTIRHNETTTPRTVNKEEADKAENSGVKKTDQAGKEEDKFNEWKEVEPSKKEKNKLCNEAKSDLAAISGRGRMREINDKGEYVFLTEPQRQQRISAAKKKKQKYCH